MFKYIVFSDTISRFFLEKIRIFLKKTVNIFVLQEKKVCLA